MEAIGEVELRTHELEQLRPKTLREVSVLFTHNGTRQAPIVHHMLEE